jgi:hypothetical protein
MGSVSVPKVMEPDPRQIYRGQQVLPRLRQAARLHWLAILAGVDKRGRALFDSKPKQLFGLREAVSS